MPHTTFLDHTADVAFEITEATSLEELFIAAAEALFSVMKGEITVAETHSKTFKKEAEDLESLLYQFLEEFIFLHDSEGILASNMSSVTITFLEGTYSLHTTFLGDLSSNYDYSNDVKAVTFSDMYVRKEKETFSCRVVLDV